MKSKFYANECPGVHGIGALVVQGVTGNHMSNTGSDEPLLVVNI